jgi:hypothetical protein
LNQAVAAGIVPLTHGILFSALLLANPAPKDPPPGPPLTEERILEVLKTKGELAWADDQYRLKVKKVNGLDLVDFELRYVNSEKKNLTLKGRTGRIRIERESAKLKFYFDEGTVLKDDMEATFYGAEWEFPAPREGKRK